MAQVDPVAVVPAAKAVAVEAEAKATAAVAAEAAEVMIPSARDELRPHALHTVPLHLHLGLTVAPHCAHPPAGPG